MRLKYTRPKQYSLFGKPDKGTLLFVADNADLFLSHRLPIALTALNSGYEVHVAAPYSFVAEQMIESYSIIFHAVPMATEKFQLFADIRTLFALLKLFKEIAPDIVHLIAFKPTLYGSIAARLRKIPAVVATITGIRKFLPVEKPSNFIASLYRFGFKTLNLRVTFQNRDDRDIFLNMDLVSKQQIVLIRGTGVNMQQFRPMPERHVIPIVLLASRMRWDKGIGEFVLAARKLHQAGIQARFVLVGNIDPTHPEGIPSETLEAWQKEGIVEWWGERPNMATILFQAHIVCLPSYREGLPKVLVEAAACGKPIVATDVPGCREIVEEGKNGILVPSKDVDGLALALNRLLSNTALRISMGREGREKVVSEFSIVRVVDKTLHIYETLLASS